MKWSAAWLLLAGAALSACATAGKTAPLPTVVLPAGGATTPPAGQGAGGGVTASGVVVPDAQAELAFVQAGAVKTVSVGAGDQVRAGQLLLELENVSAQSQLELAKRTLRELQSQSSIAAAEQALAAAQQAASDAQKKVVGLTYPRASDALIENTAAAIDLARQELTRTSNDFRSVQDLPDGDSRKAGAQLAMTNAQLNLNKLVANYNWYKGKPSDIDVATAQANLDAANAAVLETRWFLAALKGEATPSNATGTKLAQLQSARDALAAAQSQFDGTRLVSPFAGTVAVVKAIAGEYVAPGQTVVAIVDPSHVHVETTDLSERDVPRVKVGQTATVTVKALGQDIAGKVTVISPLAETLGGDVVYRVTIELTTLPSGLLPGMSVDVSF
jgi:HlyD family secretion protein